MITRRVTSKTFFPGTHERPQLASRSCSRLKLLWFCSRRESARRRYWGAKSFTDGEDKWQGANERQEKNDLEYPRLSCQTRLPRDSMDPAVFSPPWKRLVGNCRYAIPIGSFTGENWNVNWYFYSKCFITLTSKLLWQFIVKQIILVDENISNLNLAGIHNFNFI